MSDDTKHLVEMALTFLLSLVMGVVTRWLTPEQTDQLGKLASFAIPVIAGMILAWKRHSDQTTKQVALIHASVSATDYETKRALFLKAGLK